MKRSPTAYAIDFLWIAGILGWTQGADGSWGYTAGRITVLSLAGAHLAEFVAVYLLFRLVPLTSFTRDFVQTLIYGLGHWMPKYKRLQRARTK